MSQCLVTYLVARRIDIIEARNGGGGEISFDRVFDLLLTLFSSAAAMPAQ